MNRVFIPKKILDRIPLLIEGDLFHRMGHVLRARAGDRFTAICGDGYEYIIQPDRFEKNRAFCCIIDRNKISRENPFHLTLYQGTLKGRSMEEIIPAMVYLGVNRLVPVISERSQNRETESSRSKEERLRGIIERATLLSGRTRFMEYSQPIPFETAIGEISDCRVSMLFYENEESAEIWHIFENITPSSNTPLSIGILIGPEGGFTHEEIEMAKGKHLNILTLGNRILSAVTAPVIAVSGTVQEINRNLRKIRPNEK